MIRKATLNDLDAMYEIRCQAAKRMKKMGIDQWQDQAPEKSRFKEDIEYHRAFVYEENELILATATFQIEPERTYEHLVDISIPACTCHRIAVSDQGLRRGIASSLLTYMESYATSKRIKRLYVDTHHDNLPMQRMLQNKDYAYIGDIIIPFLRSNKRMLFMKTLTF